MQSHVFRARPTAVAAPLLLVPAGLRIQHACVQCGSNRPLVIPAYWPGPYLEALGKCLVRCWIFSPGGHRSKEGEVWKGMTERVKEHAAPLSRGVQHRASTILAALLHLDTASG